MPETGNGHSDASTKKNSPPNIPPNEAQAPDGSGENIETVQVAAAIEVPANADPSPAVKTETATGDGIVNSSLAAEVTLPQDALIATEAKDKAVPATPPVTPISSGDQPPQFPPSVPGPDVIQSAVSPLPETVRTDDSLASAIPAVADVAVSSTIPIATAIPAEAVSVAETFTAPATDSAISLIPVDTSVIQLASEVISANADVVTAPVFTESKPSVAAESAPIPVEPVVGLTLVTTEAAADSKLPDAILAEVSAPAVSVPDVAAPSIIPAPISDIPKPTLPAQEVAAKGDNNTNVRDEEVELLKARVRTLETELVGALSRPGTKNHVLVETIRQQHEELLSKARGMLFDKTKIVKNQELQIEALNAQVASLKDVNSITKDLLEIRNSEIKHLEERLESMESRFKSEKERHMLVLKRAETGQSINNDLKAEYETQLKIFKELREKYEQRVQALMAENKRLAENAAPAQAAPTTSST